MVVLGFYATLTAKVISWQSVTRMCCLAFLHQYYHNFLSKATNYFSHMLQHRWEAKILRKESSPQPPGHKSHTLTTETSGRGWWEKKKIPVTRLFPPFQHLSYVWWGKSHHWSYTSLLMLWKCNVDKSISW